MKNYSHFVVMLDKPSVTGLRQGILLSLQGTTEKECEAAIAWQVKGGFNADQYLICTPAPHLPGILEYTNDKGDPQPVLIHRGFYRDTAFSNWLVENWGYPTEEDNNDG